MRDLVDLLTEAHQEVPSWLESLGYETRHSQNNRRSGQRRYKDETFFILLKTISLPVILIFLTDTAEVDLEVGTTARTSSELATSRTANSKVTVRLTAVDRCLPHTRIR